MGKAHKFKKDFAPEQYSAYLERKAKNPDALIPENERTEIQNLILERR